MNKLGEKTRSLQVYDTCRIIFMNSDYLEERAEFLGFFGGGMGWGEGGNNDPTNQTVNSNLHNSYKNIII